MTMTSPDQAWWARARQARDRLVAQFLQNPAVQAIDIGLDPLQRSTTPVLRVHIGPGLPTPADLPSLVDDIPVRAIVGNYAIESDS
jgi:hypothetical protein